MIKSVIFDIDDTLYDYSTAHKKAFDILSEYVFDNLSIDKEIFLKKHSDVMVEFENKLGKNNSAIHNRLIRYQRILEILEKPIFPHAFNMYMCYWDNLIDNMVIEEGCLDYIKHLKDLGIKIGVGTNMTAYIQYKKLLKLGLSEYIDFIVTSEEVGFEKPHHKFFEYCIERSGFKAFEHLFIGDSLENDVQGAILSGMSAIHYKDISYNDLINNAEKFIYR